MTLKGHRGSKGWPWDAPVAPLLPNWHLVMSGIYGPLSLPLKEGRFATHLPVTWEVGAQVFLDPRNGPGYQERRRTVLSTFAYVPNFFGRRRYNGAGVPRVRRAAETRDRAWWERQ